MKMPAIVLAGERAGGNPLAQAFNQPAGVLVEVAGQTCISRVIKALQASQSITGGIICGPAESITASSPIMQSLLADSTFSWRAPAAGPADSAVASLADITERPVLVTAADHALLTPDIIDTFCRLAATREADFVVGFVPHSIVKAAYPDSKRTVLKFADQHFCGSNLYMVLTPRGDRIIDLWRRLQEHRKQPWKMARAIGLSTLAAYLSRRLTIAEALDRLSEKAECRIAHVEILSARAAVDVDSLADHALAEKILAEKRLGTC